MKNIKFIALDFDGTILDKKGNLSLNLCNKLIELQENGYIIVLASGRSLNGILDVAQKIKLSEFSGYISCYNGAEVYKYEEGNLKQLYCVGFKESEVKELVDIIGDNFLSITTYQKDVMSVSNIIPQIERSSKIMKMEVDKKFIKDTPKILLIDTVEGIKNQKELIKKKVYDYDPTINVFSSVGHLLEITPGDAQKGKSLDFIAKITNTNNSNFICFGDEENDLSMFEFCKYSVAMGNAIDLLKEKSTYITKTNKEDGVYLFLEEHLK